VSQVFKKAPAIGSVHRRFGGTGAVGALLGRGQWGWPHRHFPRQQGEARETIPVGAWDGWVQLWRLLTPSGSGAAGREMLPALGSQPSPAAAQPLGEQRGPAPSPVAAWLCCHPRSPSGMA